MTAESDQSARTTSPEPRASSPAPLTLLTLGQCDPRDWQPLEARFRLDHIAGQEADRGVALDENAAVINDAVDRAPAWLLIRRPGEHVSSDLTDEIARIAVDPPAVSACRIVVLETWAGKPLWRRNRRGGGEIRLLHTKRGRFVRKEGRWAMQIRGTVARAGRELTRVLWSSEEEHRRHLEAVGVPHSTLRRFLVFAGALWRERRRLTTTAVRAIWLDAGWDRAGEPARVSGGSLSGGSPGAPC
ncbi:MAG TPA: hypothetical protein VMS12_03545 [Thermoanaerobaculia bacterium]|nr:hypothetical protein [Thermoanaerobaculia bacterium]